MVLNGAEQTGSLDRGARLFSSIGRLRQGVDLETARAELQTIAGRLQRNYPNTNGGWTVTIEGLQDSLVKDVRLALVTLFGAVTFVCFVGCANVANLLLARGIARRREIAIRRALGARRSQIVRHLLTETLLLSLAGGLISSLLAKALLPLLLGLASEVVSGVANTAIDRTALGYCMILSLGTTVIIGLIPALDAIGVDFNEDLQSDSERAAGSVVHSRFQTWLVAMQVALSLVLVVGALLLTQSVCPSSSSQPGFRARPCDLR